jgi:hypothetical protein
MNEEGNFVLGVLLFAFVIFVCGSFVSASNSVAMPSDCNKMISSFSSDITPLIISIDVENKLIYVSYKDSTKKVGAFEYADCFRNIDGLIKNQIYQIGNVKIKYYNSKSSVSMGITGNVVAPATGATPPTRTTRGTTTITRSAATTRTSPSTSSANNAKTTTVSGNKVVKVDKVVNFRGYKYVSLDDGKRSNVYVNKEGKVYLQRPSFGGIVTDYFYPDKKLGVVSVEPAGNFIDLDSSASSFVGANLFDELNGKMIDDNEKIVKASASKDLKIAGTNGEEVASGIIIDGRGYLRPKSNPKETIGEMDKTGKVSMYDPSTYSSATKASLGNVANQIHNTKAANGVLKDLTKIGSDKYATPPTKTSSPSLIKTATGNPPSTSRTTTLPISNPSQTSCSNSCRSKYNISNINQSDESALAEIQTNINSCLQACVSSSSTTTPTPSTQYTACQKSCAQSTGYNLGSGDSYSLAVILPGQAEQQKAYNQCVQLKCSSSGTPGIGSPGTPSRPGTSPGIGSPGGGSSKPGGGTTKPGSGSKPGSGTGGSCIPGSAAKTCGCGSTPSNCLSSKVSWPPKYETYACRTGLDGSADWVLDVSNCDNIAGECKLGSTCTNVGASDSCSGGVKLCEKNPDGKCSWSKCKSSVKPRKK